MAFEISCEAAVDGQPSEGSLDDPAFGKNHEAPCMIGPLDDLDGSRRRFADHCAGITAVADDHLQERKARRQFVEQPSRTIAILDAGGMDIGLEEKAQNVGEDVALASLDLLTCVVTDRITSAASYTFKHALIQDAAYESLLKSTRRSLHARVAEALEALSPNIVETQPELLAHHYTEAGSILRALDNWQRAGQRALERSANMDAIAHAERGLGLLDAVEDEQERGRREIRLQNALGVALMQSRDRKSVV